MFKMMTNHMVLHNQETIYALHGWTRKFDICKVNGENVSVACAQCRAVIRALDGFSLPVNMLRWLLDGFIKQLCMIFSTMNRSALMQNNHANKSVKHKCFDVFKDLDLTFIDLSTGNNWEEVGHNGSAAFPA